MLQSLLQSLRPPARQGSKEAQAQFEQIAEQLKRASLHRSDAIAQAIRKLPDDSEATIERDIAFILETNAMRRAIQRARRRSHVDVSSDDRLRFQVSTLFLKECWEYLSGDTEGRERMHLVSGTITPDGLRVLSRLEKVAYESQSAGFVSADRKATHNQIVALTEHSGHELLGMFHAHKSVGAKSTIPSQIDIQNQERFVKIGWEAIGGIFSDDGYARFFSTWKDIEFLIYGHGAELVSDKPREKIFKLEVAK